MFLSEMCRDILSSLSCSTASAAAVVPLALTKAEGVSVALSRHKPSRLGLKGARDQRVLGQSGQTDGCCNWPLGAVNMEEGENRLSGDRWRTG